MTTKFPDIIHKIKEMNEQRTPEFILQEAKKFGSISYADLKKLSPIQQTEALLVATVIPSQLDIFQQLIDQVKGEDQYRNN